ncbi:MAG: pentapeptide repeat-containing protein [Chloroflexi bacterium]|uniref:pentapeptide repeat-containing protein n=1 Tax=Candidatus Flexifilum breve TaxID=3140694 RepID=UPI003136D393|nr:pentapeptide repeat-containing protein [Chloroflexota bacterium]
MLLELLFTLLIGNNPHPRTLATLTSAILLLIASLFVLGIGVLGDYGGFTAADLFILLGGIGLLTALILFMRVLGWRVRQVSAHLELTQRTPANPRAIIEALRVDGDLQLDTSPLRGANWEGADLHKLNLGGAYLRMIGLERANLQGANLRGANLRSARLDQANLRDADLTRANLCYARLVQADLREACLQDADLSTADLTSAQFQGAVLTGAKFDAFTTLPNGQKWTRDTDWSRFGADTRQRPSTPPPGDPFMSAR